MRQTQSSLEPPNDTYGFVNRRPTVQSRPPAQESSKKNARQDRFWNHVDRSGDGCWPWLACRNDRGYGKASFGDLKGTVAHRVAWTLTNGAIPSGMVVRHLCNNPPCCRPGHLALGTNQDNSDDMVAAKRQLAGVRNHNAKLSDGDVISMREARYSGARVTDLAAQFDVTTSLVSQVCTGRGWRHVGGRITASRRAVAP